LYLFEINGGKQLQGEVTVSGSKNASLPIMAAALLAPGKSVLRGVPTRLRDIRTMADLLRHLGAKVELHDDGTAEIDATEADNTVAPYDLVKTMRASVLVLGPLLARHGKARVSLPGGCAIGSRPVNFHIKGMNRLGATTAIEEGYIDAHCDGLKGARIAFDIVSVGATENVLMAAALAEGRTIIENAACEPEIVDLANYLIAMGTKIEGAGTSEIIVEGVSELNAVEYEVMPDRIETGTLLIAGAVTGGHVVVRRCRSNDLTAVIEKMREAGITIDEKKEENGFDTLTVSIAGRPQAVNLRTQPFPGFPTDMQPPFMTLLALAEGKSIVNETIFENRFMHAPELVRMGGQIEIEGHTAVIGGQAELSGTSVVASDLRGGAALIVAGLAAKKQTIVRRIYHVDRGYEKFEEKLTGLGADIKRIWAEKKL
jgi:UDP-N-acetylglucosamine 1-carboxyvinyltransferase